MEPWPYWEFQQLDAALPTADKDRPTRSVLIGTFSFLGWGRYILRSPSFGAGAWSGYTIFHTFAVGVTVSGLCNYRGDLGVALGTTGDVVVIPYAGGAPITLLAGLKGHHIEGYGNFAVMTEPRSSVAPGWATHQLTHTSSVGVDERYLDAWIMNLGKFDNKLVAATRQGLWTYTGKWLETINGATTAEWSGDWQPFFQHGVFTENDDYVFLLGYGGRLYTWLNKMVLEWNPHGERAGWRDTGLGGTWCHGGCVAGGYLVVAIETRDGRAEVWAFNGAGWWLIDRQVASARLPIWPTPLNGSRNFDLVVFRNGSRGLDLYRLIWRDDNYRSLRGSATFLSSLLDAGERDKDKAWRKIGCVFASPEVRGVAGSLDSVGVTLEYSVDGGATWTTATSTNLGGNTLANHNVTLDADIASSAAVSRFLQLRVVWSGVVDWAPVLAGVWAEFELLDAPARRRKWMFRVLAQDQTVDRGGALLTRTGQQLAAELWQAWQDGTTLPFRDLDYTANPVQRQVRIVGISEDVARPADADLWGDSVIALTLVEV